MRQSAAAVLIVVAVACFGFGVAAIVINMQAEAACLAAGYTRVRWPSPLSPIYCVRMFLGSDSVMPLEQVRPR